MCIRDRGKPMNIREKDDRKFGFNDLVSYICDILSYNCLLYTSVISRNTPASIQRNGRNGEIPALTEPSTATLTAVLYAQ